MLLPCSASRNVVVNDNVTVPVMDFVDVVPFDIVNDAPIASFFDSAA